ncbi:MAG TPA: cobalt ABC transporter substrate-binding protein [Reyranella sp.]|nr:cobalt ABC transporter substrate-binding protein [Reyranella sp.]
MNSVIRFGVALLSLAMAGQASAHHLWLEQDGGTTRLYFGEFGENLREASPGSLDRLQPQAKLVTGSGERALKVEKSANSFAIAGVPAVSESIVAEDVRWPAFARKDGGKGLYWPAARLVGEGGSYAPVLALDVVPAGADTYRVVFKGKPLAKAKVQVITSAGWARELHTAEDGTIKVALPWRGTYVLEVHHNDSTPGKRGEDAYDVINYVTSLTVVSKQGLEPLPSLPAAAPYK